MGPGKQHEIYPGSAGSVRLDVGGWISGPAEDIDGEEMPNSGAEFRPGAGAIDRNRARREKFLANHPEWQIVHVRSKDVHEATTGDTDTELIILSDSYLGALMDRIEARYPDEYPEHGPKDDSDHQDVSDS